MKNFIRTTALLTALLFATTAGAQLRFGVKGGWNFSELSLKGNLNHSSNNIGFYIGPTVKLGLPLGGLGLDASLLYDQRSADVTVDIGNEQIVRENIGMKQKQLTLPINLRYTIGLGDLFSVFFFGGPQFAFDISDDIDRIDWRWKNSYTSINLGGGAMLFRSLQLNINYNIGCGNTGSASASKLFGGSMRGKSNSWQIGAAYYF